jgi:hypothetical protein
VVSNYFLLPRAEYFSGRRILGQYGRKIFRVELATQLKLKILFCNFYHSVMQKATYFLFRWLGIALSELKKTFCNCSLLLSLSESLILSDFKVAVAVNFFPFGTPGMVHGHVKVFIDVWSR